MNELFRKLKFRGKGIILHAPETLEKEFVDSDIYTSFPGESNNANVLVFVRDRAELLAFFTEGSTKVARDAVLWIAYPKQSSGIKTDINRDSIRVAAEEYKLKTVTAISINDTWSALRFRPL